MNQVFTAAIVGGQPLFRAGLEKLVSDDPKLTVVAAVRSVEYLDRECDVVILDLPLLVPSPEVIAAVAQWGRPLVLLLVDQPPTLVAAVRAGARGCITPHTEQDNVRDAVRTVAQHGFYLCADLVDRFQAELTQSVDDSHSLAPREIETLKFIAMGYTHAQIASRMGLSHATVNTYAKRIRAKLQVGNKADMTRMAIELGHVPRARRNHPAA